MNEPMHNHRSMRLRSHDYACPGAYFITICTHGRECTLSKIEEGRIVLSNIGYVADKYWRSIPRHFCNIELDEFCIMPNHIHGILIIQDNIGVQYEIARDHIEPLPGNGVGVRYENSRDHIESQHNEHQINRFQHIIPRSIGSIIRTFKSAVTRRCRDNGYSGFAWQRNYYEHIIRNDAEWQRIREYIAANPCCWSEDEENPHSPKFVNPTR